MGRGWPPFRTPCRWEHYPLPPLEACGVGKLHPPLHAARGGSGAGRTTAPEGLRELRAGGLASCSGPAAHRLPMEVAEDEQLVRCPVCLRELPGAHINSHLDSCLQGGEDEVEPGPSTTCKRQRFTAAPSVSQVEGESEEAGQATISSFFHKGRGGGQSPGAPSRKSWAGREEAAAVKPEDGGSAGSGSAPRRSLAQKLEEKPLAERLRPSALGDYVGQERVLGAQTLLRSLLESHEIPSLILWGPPGCGKVSGAAGPCCRCCFCPGGRRLATCHECTPCSGVGFCIPSLFHVALEADGLKKWDLFIFELTLFFLWLLGFICNGLTDAH